MQKEKKKKQPNKQTVPADWFIIQPGWLIVEDAWAFI